MIALYIITGILLASMVYLILDYRGPRYVRLRSTTAFNMKCKRARELVVHEVDAKGNLWASRGMLLYRLSEGDNRFTRVAHVPSGLSYYWLNNFTLFRRLTNKSECLEVTLTDNGSICALSAGYMWHKPVQGGAFRKTMQVPYYGFGVGRGIFSNGLLSVEDKQVFWGEYYRNTDRKAIRIYGSQDDGQTWDDAYEFAPGEIRHVHAIQKDPFTGKIWVCAGDEDHESMIGWSDDGLKTLNYIGKGSQIWRTCQLVFTPETIQWGSDTYSVDLAGIYRWDKTTEKLDKLADVPGAILYGTQLDDGTHLFSVDREGFPNEKDKKTRLFMYKEQGGISEITCGTWKHWKKGYRYSFAALKLQRFSGSRTLAFSVMNQKELPNGELLMVETDELTKAAVQYG